MSKVADFTSIENDIFKMIQNKDISENNKLNIIKNLDPDLLNIIDYRGNTILCYAVSYELITIIKHLLSHPNIDINKGDLLPLYCASMLPDKEIFKLFLEHPDIDINAKDQYDHTILAWLIGNTRKNMDDNIDMVKMILELPNVEIGKSNVSKYDTRSPYMTSHIMGYTDVIELFDEYLANNKNY